jgi:hypothetical protein
MEVDFGTPPALQRGTVHETEQDVKLCNAGPTVSLNLLLMIIALSITITLTVST